MSLETWEKEYYPNDASSRWARRNPIEHSLRKWRGLFPGKLKEHGCEMSYGYRVVDAATGDTFYVWDDTCALCVRFLRPSGDVRCLKCPLFMLRGRSCDDGNKSPYSVFIDTENPAPMIRLLEKALWISNEEKKSKRRAKAKKG